MHKTILAAMLAITYVVVPAEAYQPLKTSELAVMCSGSDAGSRAGCVAFIMGVADGMFWGGHANGPPPFCIQGNTTNDQFITNVLQASHVFDPPHAYPDAGMEIWSAITNRYPCH